MPSLPAGSRPPPPASVGPAPRRPRPSAQGQLSPRGCRPQRAGHKVPGTPRTERTRSWARQPVATGLRLCTPSGGLCPPLPPPRAAGTPGPIHSAAGSRVYSTAERSPATGRARGRPPEATCPQPRGPGTRSRPQHTSHRCSQGSGLSLWERAGSGHLRGGPPGVPATHGQAAGFSRLVQLPQPMPGDQ